MKMMFLRCSVAKRSLGEKKNNGRFSSLASGTFFFLTPCILLTRRVFSSGSFV